MSETAAPREEATPVFLESMGGALIDSARISVMAAMNILPDSSPVIVLPSEGEQPPSVHECLAAAMEWLDGARAQTIGRSAAPPTSLHVVSR